MSWITKICDKMELPITYRKILFITVLSSLSLYFVVLLLDETAKIISPKRYTLHDVEQASLKARIDSLANSVTFNYKHSLSDSSKWEQARIDSFKRRNDIPITDSENIAPSIPILLDNFNKYLLAIITIIFAIFLRNSINNEISKRKLVVSIAIMMIVSGLAALTKGTLDLNKTGIEVRWRDLLGTVSTESIGALLFILGATVIIVFVLTDGKRKRGPDDSLSAMPAAEKSDE